MNAERAARHIVLLGDSIFDNAVYVPGEPAVPDQLSALAVGRVTLAARDGDQVAGVADQLVAVPADATHLVVSVGGNDALEHVGLLNRPVSASREVFGELAAIQVAFRAHYERMLTAVRSRGLPVVVCTIYDSNYEEGNKASADAALTVFNDAIVRCAGAAGVPVIDLRRIFTAPTDYANPIEPSAVGGQKLVEVIARVCVEHDFAASRATLYP